MKRVGGFVFFILFYFSKLVFKKFYFLSNSLFLLDNFWKDCSFSSTSRKQFFFSNAFSPKRLQRLNNFFFREEFLNFLFFVKKKLFFKSRRRLLSRLNFRRLRTLGRFLKKTKESNRKILKILKKIWYSYEYRYTWNWPLKKFIVRKVKNLYFFPNFVKILVVLNYWRKYQKFPLFKRFKISSVKKYHKRRHTSVLRFLVFYAKSYRKILNRPKFWKKKLKRYRYKKAFFSRRLRLRPSPASLRYFTRDYRIEDKFGAFLNRLQHILAPHNIFLKKDYKSALSFLKNNFLNVNLQLLYKRLGLVSYFLKFKKKRSNFYFTVFNFSGEVVYYLSSGRFTKLNFRRRNRKARRSLFSLTLMVKNICKVLKKKKIFRVNIFIKPAALKLYMVRKIFYSFLYGGVKLMSFRNLISFPHNQFIKNKKIRRI